MSKRVLIVDDREENLVVLKNFFNFFGKRDDLHIFLSDNSQDAYNIVKEHKPQLIFMDLQIETSTSGMELTKKIRTDFPDEKIAIWAITAKTIKEFSDIESIEEQCYHSGCDKYFTKPYDQKKIIIDVSQTLGMEIPEINKQRMGLS